MKHLFVSYEIAKLLKDKGFNEECLGTWCNYHLQLIDNPKFIKKNKKFVGKHLNMFCSAPLYQQVIDWFREKHNIHISLNQHVNYYKPWLDLNNKLIGLHCDITTSYYQALDKAIFEAIKLI